MGAGFSGDRRTPTVRVSLSDRARWHLTLTDRLGRRAPATLLEDKVRRLEQVAEDLKDEIDETRRNLHESIAGVDTRVRGLADDYEAREAERERQRKDATRRELSAQTIGTTLFAAGVLCSVLGGVL